MAAAIMRLTTGVSYVRSISGSYTQTGDLTVTGNVFTPFIGTATAVALGLFTNSTTRWNISSSGHFLAGADNTYDIGASGATRPRNVYAATSFVAPTGTAAATSFNFGTAGTGWYQNAAGDVRLGLAGSGIYAFRNPDFSILSDSAAIYLGSATDVSLSRGAANRLDLASGDDFNLVDGEIYMQATEVMRRGTWNSVANVVVLSPGGGRTAFGGDIAIGGGNVAISATAPTVTSAGTSPSVTASNGTAAFRVNVGTGGTATTIVMAMPAASNGWNCFAENITATAANRANQRVVMVSSTTTSITVQNQTISTGAALAFTASDIVAFTCTAY